MIAKLFTLTAALALPLALSACGRDSDSDQNLSSLDASLTNAEDPALRSALGDQIIVDPELADQSNAHRVRPADRPVDGALPAIAGKEYNAAIRSEEHTSELQSLMRISYAVFCLKKKTQHKEMKQPQI